MALYLTLLHNTAQFISLFWNQSHRPEVILYLQTQLSCQIGVLPLQYFIRISVSGLLGFVITAALFIAMLNVLDTRKNEPASKGMDFSISYIKAEQETQTKSRKITKPPEPKKTSQPPAVPRLQLEQNHKTTIDLSNSFTQGKNINILEKINLPGFKMAVGATPIGTQGGIKAAMPPIYPPAAIMKNKEGWVQVLISVNEVGQVSDVSVLNANPARLFDSAALKAVRKWKFYTKNEYGKAVPYQFTQTIEFKLDQLEEQE